MTDRELILLTWERIKTDNPEASVSDLLEYTCAELGLETTEVADVIMEEAP